MPSVRAEDPAHAKAAHWGGARRCGGAAVRRCGGAACGAVRRRGAAGAAVQRAVRCGVACRVALGEHLGDDLVALGATHEVATEAAVVEDLAHLVRVRVRVRVGVGVRVRVRDRVRVRGL